MAKAANTTTVDGAREALDFLRPQLEEFQKRDMTESDTRSKVIDSLLFNILGWSEKDVEREEYTGNGFFDYCVSAPGFAFIIEAKRTFEALKLPVGTRHVTLKSLLKGNEEHIKQIRGYLVDEGMSHGVVTNGRQFIVAQFVNHNRTPWEKNRALVFDGLEDVVANFIEFYNALSKVAVVENGGFGIDQRLDNPVGRNLLNEASDRSKEVTRNTISANLAAIIDSIFGDIFTDALESQEEFLRECFVENNETRKNREEIERLFGDYSPELSEVVPAQNAESIHEQISDEIQGWGAITSGRAPSPIIIVGSKGAGKTTFINYLIKHKLGEQTKETNLFVYLDFRKYYDDNKLFDPQVIADDILGSLYEQYHWLDCSSLETLKLIYRKELAYNDSNVWKLIERGSEKYNEKLSAFFETKLANKVNHLEKLSLYLLSNQRRRLAIVIDNCDQFSEEIQKKVFLFGHSLHHNAKCGVLISLREGYYYRWRVQKPFDAYVSNVYHVSAPKYGLVLQKRITYTLKKLEQRRMSIRGDLDTGAHLQISIPKIIDFLSSLNQSVLHSDNAEIIDFLNYTTFPNIREGLSVFKQYLTSGHTNVEEIVLVRDSAAVRGRRANLIPFHEFVKAVGLQSQYHYHQDLSVVKNLFYPETGSIDHFIKLRILQYLSEKHRTTNAADRFESIQRITQDFVEMGYRVRDFFHACNTLFGWGMIDSKDLLSDVDWLTAINDEALVGITPKGHYYLTEFVWRFTYMDLVLQDTPVFESSFFEAMKNNFPAADEKGKRPLDKRLVVAREFVSYLLNMEERESIAVVGRFGHCMKELILPKYEANEGLVKARLERVQSNFGTSSTT